MEKFDLLLPVLRDLQEQGVLKYLVLVGSWCQDIYRSEFNNTTIIAATSTMDADFLIPRRLPHIKPVNVPAIMEKHGFVTQHDYLTELAKFMHPELDIEFLTNSAATRSVGIKYFKQLGVSAQELRYMQIPLQYQQTARYRGITLNIPQPEAFTLHKLIVCTLRKNPDKAMKDAHTARDLLLYFDGKKKHIKRLRQIYDDFKKGWQKKVRQGLEKIDMELPE